MQLTAFNIVFLEKMEVEFKKCIAYSEDDLIEY
jgi:hypothetical protein